MGTEHLRHEGLRANVTYHRQFFFFVLCVTLLLSYTNTLIGYKKEVEPNMEIIRFICIVEYFLLIFVSLTQIKIRQLLLLHIGVFIILILWIKLIYNSYELDVFGYSKDSYKYLSNVVKYSEGSYGSFIKSLLSQRFFLDDIGYFTITFLFYRIYPDVIFVEYAMIGLNLILLYFSCLMLYRLQFILTGSKVMSNLTAILWGASPFLLLTISDGMKEVVFTSIIIFAVYNIYKYRITKDVKFILTALLFVVLTLFFRTAVFYMLLIFVIVVLTINNRNKKTYFVLMIAGTIFVFLIADFVFEHVMGVSLEFILRVSENRFNKASEGNAAYASYLPILAAIFGPFPVLDRPALFSIEYSPAVFIRDALGFSCFACIYSRIKALDIRFLPLIIYIFMSILMLVLAGVTLDMRYHITYVPFFFLMAVPYIKNRGIWDIGYLLLMIVIIYFYGTRSL